MKNKNKYVYLFEEYINNNNNRVSYLLNKIKKLFETIFNEKTDYLSEKELNKLQLIDIKLSVFENNISKNLTIDFTNEDFLYKVILLIKESDVKNKKSIEDLYIKINVYDNVTNNLVHEWHGNVKMKYETGYDKKFNIKVKLYIDDDIEIKDNKNDYEDLFTFILKVCKII